MSGSKLHKKWLKEARTSRRLRRLSDGEVRSLLERVDRLATQIVRASERLEAETQKVARSF